MGYAGLRGIEGVELKGMGVWSIQVTIKLTIQVSTNEYQWIQSRQSIEDYIPPVKLSQSPTCTKMVQLYMKPCHILYMLPLPCGIIRLLPDRTDSTESMTYTLHTRVRVLPSVTDQDLSLFTIVYRYLGCSHSPDVYDSSTATNEGQQT